MARWQILHDEHSEVPLLQEKLGISRVTAHIICNRGFTDETSARRFLYPSLNDLYDPFLMKDMDRAVMRIITALETNEKICVVGDYDADGITATSLVLSFFKMARFDIDFYIPNRQSEGYGIKNSIIDTLAEKGTSLIITVDNGISAIEQVVYARDKGIDVVVTDHHMPGKSVPEAVAVINPKQSDCTFPFKDLAGVGVAFNLVMALRKVMREIGYFNDRPEPNLRYLLDLVAIGTVADIAPLVDENRLFVKCGIEEIKRSTNHGINALKIVSMLDNAAVSTQTIGFRLAPRINAAGRVDDQTLGVKLLTTDDPVEAGTIAEHLNHANMSRQSIEQKIYDHAVAYLEEHPEELEKTTICLVDEEWHPGVIGIVASRLARKYLKPAVVFSKEDEYFRGSARSVGTFNIFDPLQACSNDAEEIGGHRFAAGLVIRSDKFEDFSIHFEEEVKKRIKPEDIEQVIIADAVVEIDEIDDGVVEELSLCEPFGEGNPEPVFVCNNATVTDSRVVGTNHLKLRMRDDLLTLDAIGFSMADQAQVQPDDHLDIAYVPTFNTWNGITSIQLKLKDIRKK
jgi:single-stranded-DNA-specific exonuclease